MGKQLTDKQQARMERKRAARSRPRSKGVATRESYSHPSRYVWSDWGKALKQGKTKLAARIYSLLKYRECDAGLAKRDRAMAMTLTQHLKGAVQ